MNKRARISIILPLILIFLSAIAAHEAPAQPLVKFEVVVEVFTSGQPLCTHGVKPLNGAEVEVTIKTVECYSRICCTVEKGPPVGQSSGTTGKRKVERVNEKGEKEVIEEEGEKGKFTASGDLDVSGLPEDYPWEKLKEDPTLVGKKGFGGSRWTMPSGYISISWEISVHLRCPPDHPYPKEKVYTDLVSLDEITGNGTPDDPYVMHFSTKHFCSCGKKVGLLLPGGQAQLVAFVGVKEEEKVQVARQIGGEVVATVFVNDEPRTPPEPEEGITVNPGDVVQLISTVGTFLGEFTFVPKEKIPPPPSAPVIECPSGKSTLMGVQGDFAGTAIGDMAVTTGSIETAVAPGPEKVPAVTGQRLLLLWEG